MRNAAVARPMARMSNRQAAEQHAREDEQVLRPLFGRSEASRNPRLEPGACGSSPAADAADRVVQ
jgi:hypothetical protein